MSPQAAVSGGRPARRVIFDGQSLPLVPATATLAFPARVMSGRGVPWTVTAVGASSWTAFSCSAAATRTHIYGPMADRSILVMAGGTTDLTDGDTGAQAFADAISYADAARTAGFDRVIALTIPPSTALLNTEPLETARTDHNTLMVADAGSDFDAIVDLSDDPDFEDATSTYFSVDETHFSIKGARAAARLLAPHIETALA